MPPTPSKRSSVTNAHLRDFTQDPKNARAHTPRNVGMIQDSIQKAGFGRSLLADKDGQLIAGNATWEALGAAGMDDVILVDSDGTRPIVIRRTDLTADDPRAVHLGIMDNRAAELATWDTDALTQVALSFPEAIDAAFFPEELDSLLGAAAAAELLVDPVGPNLAEREILTKPGDWWRVGDAYVACVDARETLRAPDNYFPANLLIFDPPYGVEVTGGTKDPRSAVHKRKGREKLTLDNDTQVVNLAVLRGLLLRLGEPGVLAPGAAGYVFCPGSTGTTHIRPLIEAMLFPVREEIVLIKDNFVFGRQDYHWRHETALYGWTGGAAHYFVDDRTQDTVWDFGIVPNEDELAHPAQKPVTLLGRMIGNSSRPGWVVFDPCCGSGNALVAAQQFGRRSLGFDTNPGYIDLTVERLQLATGMTAQRVSAP